MLTDKKRKSILNENRELKRNIKNLKRKLVMESTDMFTTDDIDEITSYEINQIGKSYGNINVSNSRNEFDKIVYKIIKDTFFDEDMIFNEYQDDSEIYIDTFNDEIKKTIMLDDDSKVEFLNKIMNITKNGKYIFDTKFDYNFLKQTKEGEIISNFGLLLAFYIDFNLNYRSDYLNDLNDDYGDYLNDLFSDINLNSSFIDIAYNIINKANNKIKDSEKDKVLKYNIYASNVEDEISLSNKTSDYGDVDIDNISFDDNNATITCSLSIPHTSKLYNIDSSIIEDRLHDDLVKNKYIDGLDYDSIEYYYDSTIEILK